MLNRFRLPAAVLLAAALCPAQDYVDQVVERARKEFNVPGIAVAIVKDGSVVLAKGFGVRKQGEGATVTAKSLCRIASNTKEFTTAALAMLVDERKIRWDDPVMQHMPGFQLYDPYVTREMTIRDLLTHRSGLGLGAGDLMFFPPGDLGRDEIIKRLRFIKPATSFRSAYAYDNLLYIAAGQLIPAVTGRSWDDFVRERIFTPLGMSNTFTDVAALKRGEDVATPHNALSGKLEALPQEDMDTSAPAGAIITCVADLAKWMNLQLNGGMAGTKRLFSAAQSREMWSAQTILPIEELSKDAPAAFAATQPNFHAYGLGWDLRDYRGQRFVGHTGKLSIYLTHTPDLAGDLEHWQYDTFVARWKNRTLEADAYVTFTLKPDGSIDEVRMAAVSPLTDFSFDFQDLLFHPVPINVPPK